MAREGSGLGCCLANHADLTRLAMIDGLHGGVGLNQGVRIYSLERILLWEVMHVQFVGEGRPFPIGCDPGRRITIAGGSPVRGSRFPWRATGDHLVSSNFEQKVSELDANILEKHFLGRNVSHDGSLDSVGSNGYICMLATGT